MRIGIALSKVGTTISITSISDLILLGLVWLLVGIPPVREFCVFAAVLIVTDWFMLHTFFLTVSATLNHLTQVLSIDAQRLELADVLADGVKREPEQTHDRPSSWRKMVSARTAKGGSLIIVSDATTVLMADALLRRNSLLCHRTASAAGHDR